MQESYHANISTHPLEIVLHLDHLPIMLLKWTLHFVEQTNPAFAVDNAFVEETNPAFVTVN
jgi:hypothetical protein